MAAWPPAAASRRRVRCFSSRWIAKSPGPSAARTYSDGDTDAHTNPVYVYVGDQRPFNAASARQIIARLEGSAAAIPNPEIVARIGALRAELNTMIREGRSALPPP